jgi:hypothetical protein
MSIAKNAIDFVFWFIELGINLGSNSGSIAYYTK